MCKHEAQRCTNRKNTKVQAKTINIKENQLVIDNIDRKINYKDIV